MRSYEYNESHKVTKITDFDGSVMTRTYNQLNRPEVITDQNVAFHDGFRILSFFCTVEDLLLVKEGNL